MPQTYKTVTTNAGRNAMQLALAQGDTIQLTHMAVGDGNGSPVTPASNMTALVHEVYRAQINTLSVDETDQLTVELMIPQAQGPFYIREVAAFMSDGTMFAIGNTPLTEKTDIASGSATDLLVRMVIRVSDASVVEIRIDPAQVLATRGYVDELADSLREELVPATATRLGLVKIGDRLAVTAEGRLSASVMVGATAAAGGFAGAVPAPDAGDQNNYLRGDGTWGGGLSDSVSSSSSTTGASSKAVKAAKEAADSAQASASAALTTANNALPKTGGELSGNVTVPGTVNNLDFGYSFTNRTGGLVAFRSASYSGNPGGIEITARTGSATSALVAKASGELQWGGKNVTRSVNGVDTGANGDISIPTVAGRTANGFTIPAGGTWMWIIATDSSSEVPSMSSAGYSAGGSYINSGIPGHIGFAYFAFRVA